MGPDLVELRLIRLDGSEPRILYRTDEQHRWVEPCAWFPDGRHILASLTGKDGTDKIVRISVADKSLRIIKTVGKDCLGYVSLSPDGRFVVYSYRQGEDLQSHDISVVSFDGTRELPLVEHPAHDFVLGWAPDGKNILFASDRTGTMGIWITTVSDGKPRGEPKLLKQVVDLFDPLGFTKDGSYYYGTSSGSDDIFITTLDQEKGKVIYPLKKAVQQYEGSNLAATYSPDGKYLAYIYRSGFVSRYRNRRNILCIRSLETGKEREFPLNLSNIRRYSSPRWSPDGGSIIVSGSNQPSRLESYKIDLQTGEVRYLVQSPVCEWSADGKSVFYVAVGPKPKGVRVLLQDLYTGQEKELYRGIYRKYVPYNISLSPDGRWLALRCIGPTSLKILPVAGGEARELPEFEKVATVHKPIAWTADSQYIIFSGKEPSGGKHPLYRISVESGRTEKLGLQMNRYYGLSTHPDGRRILVSGRESAPESEVWVMENFLPGTPVAKPEPLPMLRQVWSGHESPWQGKISPDGRYFSFVKGRDLAILELATGNIQRLTNSGDDSEKEYVFFSRWSPDSKQIVYEYNGDFSELRIIGLDGSEPRILYREEEGGYVRPHDWSPDGKQVLAFLGREEMNRIVLVSIDDGAMHTIKTITHGEYPYQWIFSPDGRHIVYESPQAEDSPESDIFLFSIDDKREVPIVEHLASDRILGWVPNSDMLLFASNRTGSLDAWAISVAEGRPQGDPELIKKGIGGIYPMGFSQDGAFYYTDSKQMKDIYTVTLDPETGEIDSPPNTLPVLGLGGNNNPQYSHDGKSLAYTRGNNLCIFSFETGKIRKFPAKFNARDVRWSPDSKYILFNSFDAIRRKSIYRLDVQTGNIIPISLPKKEYNIDYEYSIYFNEWSHDGKSFFYVEYDRKNKLCKILNRDFQTGNEKELYQGPEYFSISLSPDGQWLAFTSKKVEGEIMIMPASGGEPRELCKIVQPTNCPTPLAWTADGRYVLFSTVQADTWLSNLWRVPKEGGKPQKLGLEMAEMYNLTVHPNGRQIAFLSSGPSSKESEVWVMENFLSETFAVTRK